MTAKIDLMGQRFGRLFVIKDAGRDKNKEVIWLCRCDCGNFTHIDGRSIRGGYTKSCGCLQKESARNTGIVNFLHGDSLNKMSPYNCWLGMKQRCYYPKHISYRYYGGRGISVCKEWLTYTTFRDWALKNGHKKGLTIDRINNEGNYEPNNCQWITRSENAKKQWGGINGFR